MAKPVELWPAWESPDRVKYPDLNEPRSRSFYDEARALFTADNIEAAGDALNSPVGFDLAGRLRRAVYLYYWCKSGRKGSIGIIQFMPKSAQKGELDDLIKKVSAVISICEKRPGYITDLVKEYPDRDGLETAWEFTQGLTVALKHLKDGAEAKKAKTESGSGKGNLTDIARRVFCGHLLLIFEATTKKNATSTKSGPAHTFFSVCFQGFIDPNISDESTLNYLKDSIRDRDQIKASPLFI